MASGTKPLDLAVLGAGLAGLTAAWSCREMDLEVIDQADYLGGRTRSQSVGGSHWANFGAQYITPDRVELMTLIRALGVPVISLPGYTDAAGRGWSGDVAESVTEEIGAVVRRIEAERANPRPTTAAELDRQSFREWLGGLSPDALDYWELWCQELIGASVVDTSLYGVLLLWGWERSEAFSTVQVPAHEYGECIVDGGTGRVAEALAAAIGGRVSLRTEVRSVTDEGDLVAIEVTGPDGPRLIRARQVVCGLPAPAAAAVLRGLPGWKADALRSVRYGKLLTAPLQVLPAGQSAGGTPALSRPGQRYNCDEFTLCTPGDIDADGGCYHNYLYNCYARQVWDNPDWSITAGSAQALLARFPQYVGRVRPLGVQRWRHGLPTYYPGRMAALPALAAPCGRIAFCGDYTYTANMEGAVRSGLRAAAQIEGTTVR